MKRIWMFVSLMWSLFWFVIALAADATSFGGVWLLILAPWIIGVSAWGCWWLVSGGLAKDTAIRRY